MFSLAQTKEPLSKPPQTVEDRLGRGLEVQVWFEGQAVPGIRVSLWQLDSTGRLQPTKLKPSSVFTDAKGVAGWSSGLGDGVWVVRLQSQDGFALSLPTTPEFLGTPLQIGPYQVKVQLFAP